MRTSTVTTDELMTELVPELRKLCENCPNFGEIVLRVAIHDGAAGRVSLGIETARRIVAKAERGSK